MQAMAAVWSKGYDELNFISHRWGTVLSHQAISLGAVPIDNWVTMGSPMAADNLRPSGLRGEWINFFSNSDPVMWLSTGPWPVLYPFGSSTPGKAAEFQDATKAFNVTGMKVPLGGSVYAGLTQEHPAYWTHGRVLAKITQFLQ